MRNSISTATQTTAQAIVLHFLAGGLSEHQHGMAKSLCRFVGYATTSKYTTSNCYIHLQWRSNQFSYPQSLIHLGCNDWCIILSLKSLRSALAASTFTTTSSDMAVPTTQSSCREKGHLKARVQFRGIWGWPSLFQAATNWNSGTRRNGWSSHVSMITRCVFWVRVYPIHLLYNSSRTYKRQWQSINKVFDTVVYLAPDHTVGHFMQARTTIG